MYKRITYTAEILSVVIAVAREYLESILSNFFSLGAFFNPSLKLHKSPCHRKNYRRVGRATFPAPSDLITWKVNSTNGQ